LTLQSAGVALIFSSKLAKVLIATNGSPLNQTITANMAVFIVYTSTPFTDVRDELRFLFDVAQDSCKGITISNLSVFLQFLQNILFGR
jgi:hypothetical protein